MLRISRRADYAIRVMIAVASVPDGMYISTAQVGQLMLIPQPFVTKVIGDLKRAGLIVTIVGRRGGLRLSRPPETINLRHIVEAVEGPIALNFCLIQSGECPFENVCPVHPVWERAQNALCRELETVSLVALVEGGAKSGYLTLRRGQLSSSFNTPKP